uniref:Uncharacterized protein n=1 Tax=Podoviridae sp. ctuch15 TaxID=2827752 RepID=A0A8S5T2G6_9CAUD|nr:MAG TPA: hypothetical protein [Podoviridae sp. ctuch15]
MNGAMSRSKPPNNVFSYNGMTSLLILFPNRCN